MSRPLGEHYDTLFMDCPPGISLLSESVLRAADALIVPLLPTPLSVRMLEQLVAFIADNGWTDLKLLPVFSMVDRRKSLHHEVIAATRERFAQVLQTEVPYSSEIERVALRRAPHQCVFAGVCRRRSTRRCGGDAGAAGIAARDSRRDAGRLRTLALHFQHFGKLSAVCSATRARIGCAGSFGSVSWSGAPRCARAPRRVRGVSHAWCSRRTDWRRGGRRSRSLDVSCATPLGAVALTRTWRDRAGDARSVLRLRWEASAGSALWPVSGAASDSGNIEFAAAAVAGAGVAEESACRRKIGEGLGRWGSRRAVLEFKLDADFRELRIDLPQKGRTGAIVGQSFPAGRRDRGTSRGTTQVLSPVGSGTETVACSVTRFETHGRGERLLRRTFAAS